MPRRKPGDAPKRRGRPSKIDPALVEKFLAHIREGGLWRDDAARLVGLGTDVIDGWLRKGRKNIEAAKAAHRSDDSLPELDKYGKFVMRLEAAESELQGEMLGVVVEIARTADAETRLRAATWYLSRKNNRRYGSGSQRDDLIRNREDDNDTDEDVGAFVMDALGRWTELELLAETNAGAST